MKIGYTFHTFMNQKYGGISRYIVRLAEELDALGMETRAFPAIHQNKYIGQSGIPKGKGLYMGWLRWFPKEILEPINCFINASQFAMWHPEILHQTFYSNRTTWKGNVPVVLTVHDFVNEHFPQNSYKPEYYIARKRAAINQANGIICISENTRKDLLHFYPDLDEERITTIYHGVDSPVKTPAPTRRGNFILHVGMRARYKNFENLVRAYAASGMLRQKYKIVAFGGKPFSGAEKRLFGELQLDERQIQRVAGDDLILNELYSKAAILVYPSLYEGFGIPTLEAMAHGCPVAASNSSSIPEVVGNAARLFDPTSIEDITLAIEEVLTHQALRDSLIDNGFKRVRLFSWKKCASETRHFYERIMQMEN